MKKLLITLLAIFYLGASSGATVHVHYCMGKLIDWGMSDDKADDCSNCGMKKGTAEDCCKDKEHKLSLKDSPKASPIVYQFSIPAVEVPVFLYNESGLAPYSPLVRNTVCSDTPARTQAIPVFVRNCNFRI